MSFNKFILTEAFISNIVNNVFNKASNMDVRALEYQLKSGWYDFVDKVREEDREEKTIKFINDTFNVRLRTLDDVNLSHLKVSLFTVKEDVSVLVPIIAKLGDILKVVTISTIAWAVILLYVMFKEK